MSASASTSASDPIAIVDQLQTLTDIEGDLADTALAVAAIEQEQEQMDTAIDAEGDADAAEEASTDAMLLDNAEAIETVLESAIPAAPSPSQDPTAAAGTTTIDQDPSTLVNPQAVSSTSADEVTQAIAAVQADLNVPVLPETVLEAAVAHDLPAETAVEEANQIVVQIEEPTVQNIVEAATNPENTSSSSASTSQASRGAAIEAQLDGGIVPPAPTPAPAPAPASAPAPAPVAAIDTSLKDITLPENLSLSSPSVLANRDLVQAYGNDPKDPMVLLSLFNWAVQRTEIADARAWYEVLAIDNPTAVQPLLALINLELALSNFPQVEALFARALKGPGGALASAADVSVWGAYLHYIRRQNPIADGANADAARSTITKAYEFALKECGYDRESGEIWDEYIRFITETPAKNAWETQAQNDNLRKLYQRAVCIPLNNIEALWKAYDAFESTLNKLTSKKFLAERSPAYMTARSALREMRKLTDSLPRPILPPIPTFDNEDRRVTAAWKEYLKWEESNPLVIEDQEILSTRITYALRRCLSEMRHFPELWHYAANYYTKIGKADEAAAVLKSGVLACPKSFLLTFALAESEEEKRNYTECHSIFTALLETLTPDIEKLRKTIEKEVEIARGPEIPGSSGTAAEDIDVNMNGEMSEIQKLVEEREERGKLVAERRGKEVEELQVGLSMVWIMYLRFARRAEGLKGARAVFTKARKSTNITWHVFETAAMMEYYSNKDSTVAIKVFELGFRLFSEDVDYVIRYLQFLLSINDETNARALFERSAVKIPSSKSRPLWDTWAKYEYVYGDLSSVHKLEQRFLDVFPNDSSLKRFAQRYTYNGIDQIALRDLGFGSINSGKPHNPVLSTGPGSVVPLQPTLAVGPTPSLQGPPPPRAQSPGVKRPAPDSPRNTRRQSVDDPHSRSPKRYRANSPIGGGGGRRFPERERDRIGSGGAPRYPPAPINGHGRDRSPIVHAPPPPPAAGYGRRDERSSLPPAPAHGGYGGPPPPTTNVPVQTQALPHLDRDRSGLGKPLVWFIGNLPSARSFDGPIFRPDDIMGLFNNISHTGTGYNSAPPPPLGVSVGAAAGAGGYGPPPVGGPVRGGYPEPDRRYGGPPRGGRY